jgi:hypothetical protein
MASSIMGELFQVLYSDHLAEILQCLPVAEDESGDDSTHVEF